MTELFIYLPIVIITTIIILFVLTVTKRNQKLEIEKNLNPIYNEYCGGRQGNFNFTYPFFRLTIYKEFIVISCWQKWLIYLKDIKSIEDSGLWGNGFKLITSIYSKDNFHTSNCSNL